MVKGSNAKIIVENKDLSKTKEYKKQGSKKR